MSKTIKAIDKEAVHRICSGQVVLNLATAVKELVENSLDAGATTVEVRLREYGSDLIEVSDNGSGVLPANFEGLTAKHHTSKLQDFSDLVNVETFGFRGEALSSLCALSDVTIVTKHETEAVGSKLVLDHHGNITSVSPIARQVGTTVTIEKLFKSLPVRQKEFHRNLKREYFKMVQLLNAYGLVSTNVRISCTNQTKKGGRSVIMSTHGCKTIRENIACIFGPKQLNSLLDLKKVLPDSEVLAELKVKEEDADKFDLDGIISSCAHGQGRSSGDRQFYYINNRPCEPSKIVKCVNEVYHSFNLHQTPFVFLNITAARNSVDVNVTPDKRQIFLDHEKLLIATIKASLMNLYEKIPSTFQVNNVFSFGRSDTSSDLTLSDSQTSETSSSPSKSSLNRWRHANDKGSSDSTNKRKIENKVNPPAKQMKLDDKFVISQSTIKSSEKAQSSEIPEEAAAYSNNNSQSSENIVCDDNSENNFNSASQTSDISTAFSIESVESSLSIEIVDPSAFKIKSRNTSVTGRDEPVNSESSSTSLKSSQESSLSVEIIDLSSLKTKNSSLSNGVAADIKETDRIEESGESSQEFIDAAVSNTENTVDIVSDRVEICEPVKVSKPEVVVCDSVPNTTDSKKTVIVNNVSVESIKEALERLQLEEESESINSVTNKFHATIDPSKNSQAESELRREISKDSFSKMEIIGQFNLGFIIVQLGSDLFIIDQHATDEKYNFETLQLNTTISNQKLVVPQTLELTAANESLLLDNIEIFKKNGFEFTIDENAEPMKKVKLTAIPISQNWHFGKDDIDELLFMLQDSPGTLCRPSRVRAMFASRACRMSVMIGTALNVTEMKRLVVHMGEIEQPWNCPHGRPTMRHLINLALLR